jgi:hypothetical protein
METTRPFTVVGTTGTGMETALEEVIVSMEITEAVNLRLND